MKNSQTNIKKLIKKTFEKHSVSHVTSSVIKDIIKSEGYIISDFSTLTPTEQSVRFMKGLDISHYADYYDSFTYSDKSVRIVFIRKDVSDAEYMYLLSLELGRILTHTDTTGNVIGLSAADNAAAHEFAYHIKDLASHGTAYNFIKYYTGKSAAVAVTVAASAIMLISSYISGIIPDSDDSIFNEADAVSAFAQITNTDITNYTLSDNSTMENMTAADVLTETDSNENTKASANNVSEQKSVSDSIPNNNTSSDSPFILSNNERVFYATKSGKKYHISGCSYINGKETVMLTSVDVSAGSYEPCSRCFK